MGSYNYLGFAEKSGRCADASENATRELGLGVCGTRHELGEFYSRHELVRRVLGPNL